MVDCMRERERRTYLRHRFAGKEGEDDEGEDDEGEGSGEDLSNSDEENHPDGDQQDDQLEEDEIDDTKNPSDTGLEPRVENLDLSEESDEEE